MERLDFADFDQVFRILESSFPRDEYRTYEEQKALLSEPAYRLYGIKEADRVIAFIAVWQLDSVLFIEHFAVHPSCRNGGIGTKLLGETVRLSCKTVCLEVEPPVSEMAARRINFYKRSGFFLNEYPYMQPAMTKGRNSIPLMVMTYGQPVDEDAFAHIKNTLYKEVYKVQ